ncbi:uncharacterized protein LOC112539970 [Tetranychus urticae]|nr:uncharacterized protein LOC112539970 [Tetranychus urticae]
MIFAMVVMFIAREMFLFLEANGYLTILKVLNTLKSSNNQHFDHQMTPLKMSTFLRVLNFECLTICASMFLSIPFILILLNCPLIVNLLSFSIPSLLIYALLWSISLCFSSIFLLNAIFAQGACIIICGTYYFFKLKSLCETIDSIITHHYQQVKPRIDQLQVKSFLVDVTLYLNEIDLHIKTLRYVILYFFLLITLNNNFYIFVGLIAKTKNEIVNNLISAYGVLVVLLISLLCYIASDFVEMINYVACKLNHVIVNFNGLSIATKLKTIEFLDRSKSSYIGIKAGDFLILNKINFILFLLENASTLLLLTVNLRPILD